jgi:hypothetical protein
MNVHNVSDVRQIEVHTAEPLVPGPSRREVEIAIAKLKRYKSLGCDQILPELIQAGGEILWSHIHNFINSIWNKEELPHQQNESNIVPVYKKGNKIVVLIMGCHCYQLTNIYPISYSQG